MQPRCYLQTAVFFGGALQGVPHGYDVGLFRVAVVLGVLMPGGVCPFLIGQFGACVEDAVDGYFGGAQEGFGYIEQSGVDEDLIHLWTDEVSARTAAVVGFSGGMPGLEETVLEVDFGVSGGDEALCMPLGYGFIGPAVEGEL